MNHEVRPHPTFLHSALQLHGIFLQNLGLLLGSLHSCHVVHQIYAPADQNPNEVQFAAARSRQECAQRESEQMNLYEAVLGRIAMGVKHPKGQAQKLRAHSW